MYASTAEKLKKIQTLFDEGKKHPEIAKELGYINIKSYYRYICAHDKYLNYTKRHTNKHLSVIEDVKEKEIEQAVEVIPPNRQNISKAETIISLIDRGMDVREVAKKKRFKDTQDLADYMRSKGYVWNGTIRNYVLVPQEKQVPLPNRPPQAPKEEEETMIEDVRNIMNSETGGGCECLERYGGILKLLDNNRERLNELLRGNQTGQGEIPRYILSGTLTTKTFNMIQPLKELIIEFSEDFNIQQKEMFEIAMIEFLKKYGFGEEVKRRLKI